MLAYGLRTEKAFENVDPPPVLAAYNPYVVAVIQAVRGFFVQSEPGARPDPHPPAFGLKDRTSNTYWKDFEARIEKLQRSAPSGTRSRTSEGRCSDLRSWLADNVAVDRWGMDEWVKRWSKINGADGITWGPDARLTPLGEAQAKEVNELWKNELARPDDPIPIPTKLFSSPLARALATLDITFKDVLPKDENTGNPVDRPLVLEDLRESLAPFTSDKRSTKTEIETRHPAFEIEPSFAEEDPRWSTTFSESSSEFNARIKATLDKIFGQLIKSTDTFVSITAHSGVAAVILNIIGHRSYPLPAGGVIPVVMKIT